jgi:hypothetical protein
MAIDNPIGFGMTAPQTMDPNNPNMWNPNSTARLLRDLQMKMGIGTINPALLNQYMAMFGMGGETPVGYGASRPIGPKDKIDPVMLLQQQDALRAQMNRGMGGTPFNAQQLAKMGGSGAKLLAQQFATPPPQSVGGGAAGTNPALAQQRTGERADFTSAMPSFPLGAMPADVTAALAAGPLVRGAPGFGASLNAVGPSSSDIFAGIGGQGEAAATGLGTAGAEAGTGAATGAGAGLGATAASAVPVISALMAAFQIWQDATARGIPDEIKAANAAVDAAAAIAAPFTFGLSELAAPVAKAGIGNLFKDINTGNVGGAVGDFGPISGPTKALGSLFGADMSGQVGNIISDIDPLTGPISLVSSLFGGGGPGVYAPKRQAAGREAGAELGALDTAFQTGAEQFSQTGDVGAILKALQTKFGDRNPVRSYLTADKDLTQLFSKDEPNLNVAPGSAIQWGQVDPSTFGDLLRLYSQNPSEIGSTVGGSGDVPYLKQAQAQAIADQAKGQATQLLSFLASHMPAAGGGGAAGQAGSRGMTPFGALGTESEQTLGL